MRYLLLPFVLVIGLAAGDAAEACKTQHDGHERTAAKCPAKKSAKTKPSAEPRGISDEDWERNDRALLLNILQSATGTR